MTSTTGGQFAPDTGGQLHRILQLSRNSGATRQAFTFDQIKNFRIILPPLPLQQKFAALVEQVERLRTKQRESEHELDNMFQSLMQKYFG